MLTHIARIFKFAFQNFWRNFWLSVVTISIITLSFLSVNFFIFTNALVETSLQAIEDKVNITINFKPTTSENDILKFKADLENREEVKKIHYISKSEALEQLRKTYEEEQNKAITDALDELEANPLTSSLVITTNELDQYAPLMASLEEGGYDDIIEKKNFNDRAILIEKINILKNRVREIGIVINIFFGAIAVLIVYNTIRITIYTRKEEIGIMKLVGGGNTYIRAPLVLESALYSVAAIILTILIIYPLLGIIQPYSDKIFDGQAFDVLGYFSANFFKIFGYQLLASIILNMISSALAIGRYLKV